MIETFLAFAVVAAYWPGIPGSALSPRWALLSIIVPLTLLLVRRGASLNAPAAWVGTSLLAYAALSLFWTTSLPDGLNAFWHLSLLAGLGVIGARLASLDRIFLGAALGMGVTSGIIVLEVFGIDLVRQLTQVRPGLFFNPNIVTESATLVFIACFASRQYWASLLPLPALLLTHSRGGVLALVVAMMVWLWRRSPMWTAFVAGVIFFGVLAVSLRDNVVPDGEQFRAGIAFNSQSARDRINIWRDTIWGLTWRGTGIGSFRVEFPRAPYKADVAIKGRTDHAHNDFLEVAYELGVVGIVCFILLLGSVLRGTDEPSRLVLVAFIAEATVQFPLYMPVTGALAALCVGHLASGLRSASSMPAPQCTQSYSGSTPRGWSTKLPRWLPWTGSTPPPSL